MEGMGGRKVQEGGGTAMDREPGSPRGGKESDTTERLTHRSALEMQHVAVFPPCGFHRSEKHFMI